MGWEDFPCVFGVFDRKLGMELITCEDKKVAAISNMEKKKTKKLTSAVGTFFVSV